MNQIQNRAVEVIAIAIGTAMFVYFVANVLTDQLMFNVLSSGRFQFYYAICFGLIGYAVWIELTDEIVGLAAMLPPVLSTIWSAMWLTMQYWAITPTSCSTLMIKQQSTELWADGYTHWGVMAILLMGGYAVAYWIWRRY